MEEIREKTKQEVEELWENKLKNSFSSKINKSFMETLTLLQNELKNFDTNINNFIDDLDKKFDQKWTNKFHTQLSQLDSNNKNVDLNNDNKNNKINNINNIKNNNINNKININNDNDNINNKNIINNNINNINNVNNNNNYHNINNNDNNNKNNNNNGYNNNIINFKNDDKEDLRKKGINLKEIISPPLVKLINLDNSNPLINLVLQIITNIETLISYYFNPQKEQKILKISKEKPDKPCLGPSFINLLDHLWKVPNKEYSPLDIHKALSNIMLNKYNSSDPGYILKYIFKQLNYELNPSPIINNNNDPYSYFNPEQSLKSYSDLFFKNKTKISDSFYSTIETKKKCLNCAQITYFYEPSCVINIYLEDNNNVFNDLNLEEHLNSLLIEKENEYIVEDCIICTSPQKKLMIKRIYSSPEILIFNIDEVEKPSQYRLSK